LPWKETWPMKERLQLVTLYQTERFSVSTLAKKFQVSRKTAHKWIKRFMEEGPPGLADRTRTPRSHPRTTAPVVVSAILRAKEAHPTWGPAKLQPGPRDPVAVRQAWPSVSTRGGILARAGLTIARRRRRRTPPWSQPFSHCAAPNAVWCADFKGWFRTGDGRRCDPLTITDAYSRSLLTCRGLFQPKTTEVRVVFEQAFRHYGLPWAMRTDNGWPFASVGAGGLSTLSVWWVKLGILPERIQPGHPEQNGRHERFHRTLKETTLRPPAATLAAQQERFDWFQEEYNTLRPHEALGQRPPATLYAPALRQYPDRLEDPCYPQTDERRRVRRNGQIKWRSELVFVSEALVGETVGIREQAHGWLVSFGPIPLGMLYPHSKSLERLPLGTRPWH